MSKNIKVVIGSVFGDEGKGLMTDYFCSLAPKDTKILNVRFNGSNQAGHTVVTPEGKRHVFSHFGAGSLYTNVVTYLSSDFIVNPVGFGTEYNLLRSAGVDLEVILNEDSNILLPYDCFVNRMQERAKGANKHGSCGLGVYEAVVRSGVDAFVLKVSDLCLNDKELFDKIKNIRDNYYVSRLEELGLTLKNSGYEYLFEEDNLLYRFIFDCHLIRRHTIVADDKILNKYDYQVYEGAQGLLLDWDNEAYAPNITASHTGLKNVVKLLNVQGSMEEAKVEICYVARSYFTRHGVGRFETEVEGKEKLSFAINEKTNVTNEWQDNFRYGYFDKDLWSDTIDKDLEYLRELTVSPYIKTSVAITHLDETDNRILLDEDTSFSISDFSNYALGAPVNFYTSDGETRNDVRLINRY